VKTLTCVAVYFALTIGFASAQHASTVEDNVAGSIAEVQGTQA
jgi:hypothetical protein